MRKALFLLLIPSLAGGARADDQLVRADRLFNELEYDRAIELADQVLQSPESGPEQLLEAYRIKGLSLSGKDEFEDAYMVFLELVAIDPQFRISSDISPRLAAPFYQAVATSGEQQPITLEHQAPAEPQKLAGAELVCRVVSNPMGMVTSVRLRYRTPARELTGELKLPVEGAAELVFHLPDDLVAESILYHFEALNRWGGVLARDGGGAKPLRLQARHERPMQASARAEQAVPGPIPGEPLAPAPAVEDRGPAWYHSWWFWTAVGVVVAGSVATGVALGVDSGADTYTYRIHTR